MGDENDGFSLRLQSADRCEKLFNLLGSQNGGWFVENQKLRPAIQDLQDLNALLHAHRERFDSCPEIDVDAVGLGKLLDLPFSQAQVQPAPSAGGGGAADEMFV